MESIIYKRVWVNITAKFVTHCPYRRGLLVGSHACFFCKHCKGRTEDTVKCTFSDFYVPAKDEKPREIVSIDVMVRGEFRRTLKVKPTGLKIINETMYKVPTKADIESAVAQHCPLVYKYEKWNVEYNYR